MARDSQAESTATQVDDSAAAITGALDNRGIARAALLVMIFFVLSRVTGLAREIVIGAQFGTSGELDTYLAAFRLPDLLFQLVAGGALGSAFIPTFSSYWVKGNHEGAWLLFSRVLNGVTLILVLMAALGAALAQSLVEQIIAPGFSPEQQAVTASLMRWMLLSTVIFGASGLIMGALNALQHFLLPAVAPVLYNLSIIAGAWLLAPTLGAYGLVIGAIVGALAHLLVQIPGLWRQHAHYTPSMTFRDPGVREVLRLMGPRVLGLLFVQMHFLVNTILASRLMEGSLSALNYAWLIMLLPQGIFAQAVATAAFPTFAAQVAAGERGAMRGTFGGILRTVLFLSMPAAVLLYVMAVPIVAALLQRGQFTAESTALVAYALGLYAVGLVGHSVVEIVVRAFYALHDTLTPVVVGVGAMLLNIGLSIWWVNYLSFGGLALANSIATTLEMFLLLALLSRKMNGIDGRRLATSIVRNGTAALLMGAGVWFWLRWIEQVSPPSWLNSPLYSTMWFAAIGGLFIAALLYLTTAYLLRSRELQPAIGMVTRRLRSR